MKTAQDYLAEKLQDMELKYEIADSSCYYWRNKSLELMKKLKYSNEDITSEIKSALRDGYLA